MRDGRQREEGYLKKKKKNRDLFTSCRIFTYIDR